MPKSVASSKSSSRYGGTRRSSSTATSDSDRSGYMGSSSSRADHERQRSKSHRNKTLSSGDGKRRPASKGLADVPRGSYLSAPETCFRSFCVFNPTLSRGKEERAMDNIIYFFPPETSPDAQMNHVGFCIAVTCLSERFSSKPLTQTEIRTDNRTITLYSPAKEVWMAIETDGKYDASVCVGLMKKICRASITRLGKPVVRAALSLSNDESAAGGSLGVFADTNNTNKDRKASAGVKHPEQEDTRRKPSSKRTSRKIGRSGEASASTINGMVNASASCSPAPQSSASFNQFVCLTALMAFFDDVAVFLLNTVMVLDLRSTRPPTLRPIRPPVPQKALAAAASPLALSAGHPLSPFERRHGVPDTNLADDALPSPVTQYSGSNFNGDTGSGGHLSPSTRTANSSMSGVNFHYADGPGSPLISSGSGNGTSRSGAVLGYRRDRAIPSRVFDHRMESSEEAALRRRWTVLGSSEALLGYVVSLRLTAPSQHAVVTSIIAQYLSLITGNSSISTSSSTLTKKYTDVGGVMVSSSSGGAVGVGGGGAVGSNFDYNYTCNHECSDYDEDDDEYDDEEGDGGRHAAELPESLQSSPPFPESNEFKDAISFESVRNEADTSSQTGDGKTTSRSSFLATARGENDAASASGTAAGGSRVRARNGPAAKKAAATFQRAATHTRWAGIRYAAFEAKSLQVLTTNISPETLSIVLFLFLVDASISETPIFLGDDTKPSYIYVCCAPTVLLFLIVNETVHHASHNAISALSSQLVYEISDYLTTGTCTLLKGTVLLRGSICAAALRCENPYLRSAWAFHCGDPATSLALGGNWNRALSMFELFGRSAWTGLPLAPSRASLMRRQRESSYGAGNSYDNLLKDGGFSGNFNRGRTSSSYTNAASASYASSLFGVAASDGASAGAAGQSFVDAKYATFLSSQVLPEFSALYSGANYTSGSNGGGGGSGANARRPCNYGDAADGWGGQRGDPPPFGYTLVADSYMRANNAMRNARWMVVSDRMHFGTQILGLPRLIHWAIAGMVRSMQHDDERIAEEEEASERKNGEDDDDDDESSTRLRDKDEESIAEDGNGFAVLEYWLPFHGMTWLHMSKTEASAITCSLFSDECALQDCFDAAVKINDVCEFGAADAMCRIRHRSDS